MKTTVLFGLALLGMTFMPLDLFGLQATTGQANAKSGIRPGLKELAPKGFYIGGVVHGDRNALANPHHAAVVKKHFNVITASVYMPWGLWSGPDSEPKFEGFRKTVDWAVERKIPVHGHTLLFPWANTQCKWWMKQTDQQVRKNLERYIKSLVGSVRGKVWVWDVVNEVVANDGEPMDEFGLRTELREYKAMGPEFVELAFRWAAETDPNAKLIINSTGCERPCAKSDRLLRIIKSLKAKGVPVHGVGFQFHFVDIDAPHPDIQGMSNNLQRFANEGLEIYLTEVDVCALSTANPRARQPNRAELQRQALHFKQTLKLALAQPACRAFMLWDFIDQKSWLHPTTSKIYKLPSGAYTFPAPFRANRDGEITEKPAVNAMREAFREVARPSSRR